MVVTIDFYVHRAWRVARERNQSDCGDQVGDLEMKVLYTPGKRKCQPNNKGALCERRPEGS